MAAMAAMAAPLTSLRLARLPLLSPRKLPFDRRAHEISAVLSLR